jgi:hypothetical protein
MTFLDLQNRVKARVIDLPSAVSADVPFLINEAIRSAQRKYNFRAMEGSITMISSVGSLVPTPNTIANFKEYKDKGPYILRYLIKAKRELVTTADDAALAAVADINVPDEPDFLINSVDLATSVTSFTLYPYPDNLSDWTDGNYRIVVPYYAYTTKLVADNDTNWFVDNMDDYIYREATGQAFALDWDYNSMAVWLQQAEVKFKEAVKADKMNRLGAVDEFVPMWQGANEPQVRQ